MKVLALLLMVVIATFAKVNYPYPQNGNYPFGRKAANSQSALLKSKFDTWRSNYYAAEGDKARIKFDNVDYTVSEGIGYGMLFMVYFSDNTRSYQAEFDKLWKYYNAYPDDYGLMHWKIKGFSSIEKTGAATDAEMDVAAALVLAYYQFGDSKYLDAARKLIATVRENEFETDGLHKPGDMWSDKRNPSYIAPAAYELFRKVDQSDFWQKAIARNYTLLQKNAHGSTGLVSDWSDENGNVVDKDEFNYDASRTPWRLAWAYAWFGHTQAKALNTRMAGWIRGATGDGSSGVKAGYTRSGSALNSYSNATFSGALGCAAMSDQQHQAFLDRTYGALMQMNPTPASYGSEYFNASMQLLTGLLLSGNMTNIAQGSPPSSSSSRASSSSSRASSSSQDYIHAAGTVSGLAYWGVYADALGSQVTPEEGTSPLVNSGNTTMAQAKFNVVAEPTWYEGIPESAYPFAGMIAQLNSTGKTEDLRAASAIVLNYKSTGNIRMSLVQAGLKAGTEYGVALSPTAIAKTVRIDLADLRQPEFVTEPTPLDLSRITAVKFELKEPSGGAGTLTIAQLQFDRWSPVALWARNGAADHAERIDWVNRRITLQKPTFVYDLEFRSWSGALLERQVVGRIVNEIPLPMDYPGVAAVLVVQSGSGKKLLPLRP